jgi:UDP-N-acetylmuramate dehydrogenase
MSLKVMDDRELKDLFGGSIANAVVRLNEPMWGHTSLRIGGPVDIFISPADVESLRDILGSASGNGVPVLPVGGGTNLLVSDKGLEGAALTVAFSREMGIAGSSGDEVSLKVGAGLPLQKLVGFAREKGLSGIEGLAGIPGRIGGAIAGNAGAYGVEMKDVVVNVTFMGREGDVRVLGRDDIVFSYRHAGIPEGAVILGAELRLAQDSPGAVAERAAAFHKMKKASQPLNKRSAGCVFKNPEGRTAAGALMEEAGCKGMRIGDIEVSRKHANFFVNRRNGTAEDFLALMEKVSTRVKDAFGIVLEPEIKVVGRC